MDFIQTVPKAVQRDGSASRMDIILSSLQATLAGPVPLLYRYIDTAAEGLGQGGKKEGQVPLPIQRGFAAEVYGTGAPWLRERAGRITAKPASTPPYP